MSCVEFKAFYLLRDVFAWRARQWRECYSGSLIVGGWAAFDRTCDRPILECVPFADHNAMQDPSCPDITGRVLECLSWYGMRVGDPAIDRAIQYIKSKQEVDGCFFGRWGVNYIYGTWQSIIGPIRCGVSPVEPWILQAGEWIHSIQQESGAFGESADSYIDASLKGKGPPTASQTAWAAMLLQEVFGPHDQGLERAMEWLARTQLSASDAADKARNPDGDPAGSWCETEFTGTGSPQSSHLFISLRYCLPLNDFFKPLIKLVKIFIPHNSSLFISL